MSKPTPCPSCGRLPLHEDPAASEHMLAAIHRQAQERALSVERWLQLATLADRVAAVRWLDGLTHRPPFTGPMAKSSATLRVLLMALAEDVEQTCIDPDSPETPAGIVPMPARELTEEPARPETTSVDELKHVLGGVFEA
jgi:hypothetical protein